jgi:hypothetical protein
VRELEVKCRTQPRNGSERLHPCHRVGDEHPIGWACRISGSILYQFDLQGINKPNTPRDTTIPVTTDLTTSGS